MSHTIETLLVATHNQGKVVELSEMLSDLGIDFRSLSDLGVEHDVEETGTTFAANAALKAQSYAKMTGHWTLADDSGLVVDALNGAPGVYTARYGGPGLTSQQRYEKLLAALRNVPPEARTARFRCVVTLAQPDGTIVASTEGTCEGAIALEPAGDGGFGYDPVFLLPDRSITMAQISSDEKHIISHRGQALAAMTPLLRQQFGSA